MAAEPAPEPDLETTVRHVLPQKIDAVSYGVSLLHHDVREIRRVQDEQALQLGDLAEGQRSQGETLRSLQESVAEILRRLPPPAE